MPRKRSVHKVQTCFPGDAHFHTRKDNDRVPLTESAVLVFNLVVDRTEASLEEAGHLCSGGVCWRDEVSLKFTTRGRSSSAAAVPPGVSIYVTNGTCHNQNKERPFTLHCNRPWLLVTGHPCHEEGWVEQTPGGSWASARGLRWCCTSPKEEGGKQHHP